MHIRAKRTDDKPAAGRFVAGVEVSQPSDPLEQEAERTADQVMNGIGAGDHGYSVTRSEPLALSRCEAKRDPSDADPSSPDTPGARGLVASSVQAGGAGLRPDTRQTMERQFGHDFGAVRIHADDTAARAASAIDASAYTVGNDIVFGDGQYTPGSPQGDRLLAHELTHVVQQASDGTLVQRQAAPNAQSSSDDASATSSADGLTPQLRADVQATINLWRTQANQSVLDSAAWYADNYGQFISLTSSNSTLSWTDGKVFGVFEKAVGWAVGKAVNSLAAAMLGAEVGSIGGPPGMLAGFVVGKVAGEITGEIVNGLKGPDQTKARNAAQAGQAVNASGQNFFQQATAGQGLVTTIFTNAQKNLEKATSATTAFTIRDWALQEIAAVKPPAKGDRSLFDQMYSEWVLEHSQGTRAPIPNIGPGDGVDAAQWGNAVQNAQLVGGQAVTAHLDLFGYQTRGFLASHGLAGDKGQEMIDATQGATSQDAGRLIAQFDNKPLVFTTGDPVLLAGWLGKTIGWQQDTDPVQPSDVSDGKVKVEVTPSLSIFGAAPGVTGGTVAGGAPQGAISVTSFQVSATVPDRHTFVSSDPSDAGLPPVITERGSKTYQLGKFNP